MDELEDKKNKYKELSALVKKAEDALSEAEKFADEHDLDFGWSPAYGMGGHYYGKNTEERKEDEEYSDMGDGSGWRSSSQGC